MRLPAAGRYMQAEALERAVELVAVLRKVERPVAARQNSLAERLAAVLAAEAPGWDLVVGLDPYLTLFKHMQLQR